ncbi:hypothetical protein BpHYR1_020685 [Brachionus plicatilis]|uniref:Uncharacterized protein n=1 Tax=Brachionus plicatilis TaxID=10195 RepID=A0A3M7T723_BRAPC|nr:hypothetical protein BpHYR1_020685 [Brachionus plicatilis]
MFTDNRRARYSFVCNDLDFWLVVLKNFKHPMSLTQFKILLLFYILVRKPYQSLSSEGPKHVL